MEYLVYNRFWLPNICSTQFCRKILDAVTVLATGSDAHACVFLWQGSVREKCFPCDRDQLRAGALPSVPCLICMHRWHSISIVIAARKKKCRELTGDIWQLILRAQLQAFACILLYSGAFSSHSPLLCSAQWAYLQTVSLFRAGVRCV